jgi:hypothetical protein
VAFCFCAAFAKDINKEGIGMSISSIYKGFDVVTRVGIGSAVVIKAEMEKSAIESLLKGDYPALFILNKYDVELYSLEGMKGGGSCVFSIKNLKGFSRLRAAGKSLELDFEIPVSSKLIDCINEIRRKKRVVALCIQYSFDIARLGGYEVQSGDTRVEKALPDGERRSTMPFLTEEIDELMKRIGYIEFIRFEVPIPLIPEARIELLKKSIIELKNVEGKITEGNYPEALSISRNIIMNYLTEPVEKEGKKERVLKKEIREYTLCSIPDNYKAIYEKILKGIESTLTSNLDHVHKFIKEETGKLIAMPSREEAEYVYFMLLSTLRYISQLVITWGKTT